VKKAAATAAMLGIAAVVAVALSRRPAQRNAEHPTVAAPTAAASPRPRVRAEQPESSAQRPANAAAGGIGILSGARAAQAIVTGVVSQPTKLDTHGWRADLQVDGAFLGDVKMGDTVTIGWEELSESRAVRFADGQRVLVVLNALPTQSLWRNRFPVGERTHPVFVVASNGDAFLDRPDGPTAAGLQHYFAMGPSARDGGPGAARLADLVRDGNPMVAREALALLQGPVGEHLGADAGDLLLAAARNPEREVSLRGAALRLAAEHKLPGTRETALGLIGHDSPVRVDAYRALALLPEGLAPERIEALLSDGDPDLRTVAIATEGDKVARERLVGFVRNDPSPMVRLAAGQTLVARDKNVAIPDVIGLLDDDDRAVRTGIAENVGDLGEVAVGPLAAVVDNGSERAALAAIYGLSRTGKPGLVILASIAKSHDNKAVQSFAKLAIGQGIGHED
jgi:HEAT repeat protein